jgi:hypothetical protein
MQLALKASATPKRPDKASRAINIPAAILTGGGGFLVLGALGTGLGIVAISDALTGALTQEQIDGLVVQGQTLED